LSIFVRMSFSRVFFTTVSLIVVPVFAQIPAITGWVYNKKTLETIPGAIIVDSASFAFVESNAQGFYQFGTKQGDKTIIVAAPGYKPQKVVIDVQASVNKNFFLRPVGFGEVDSAAEYLSLYNMKPSFYSTTKKAIIQSPSVLSVSDPIKYFQFLPGVTGGIEGLSGLVVRGSNSDQNLLLMNGLPLYGNGHVWGFLSNYNTEIVKSADIYRGVAPARYGGRAGGAVVDIQTDGGAAKDWTGKMHVDPLTANVCADGPLDHRGKVTGSVGIRRSYLDWLLGAGEEAGLIGNVHDINARVDYKVDQHTQWNFWAYNGRDKYGLSGKSDEVDSLNRRVILNFDLLTSWQNTQLGTRYSREFKSNHFGAITAGLSRYLYSNLFSLDGSITQGGNTQSAVIKEELRNVITDYTVNGDFSYVYSPEHTIRYGSQLTFHTLKPGQSRIQENTNLAKRDTTFGVANIQNIMEWANYGELDMHPNLGLSVNFGMRLWTFVTSTKTYVRPEPRIIISQLLEGKKRIQLGFSVANQGLHQLSSVNGTLPRDVWFPSSATFRPQKTTQLSAAYIFPLTAGVEFSAETYYKWFDGITDLTGVDEDPLVKNYWERSIVQGKGTAQGFEAMITKKTGAGTGLVSYTYSKTERTFEYINDGEPFYYRWDRPHQFKMQFTWQAQTWLTINMSAMFMSGNVYTVPTGQYLTTDNKLVYDFTSKNNYRMPNYKRFDIGFTKEIKPYYNRGYREFWGLQVYNAFGFMNPINARWDVNTSGKLTLIGTTPFVFIPSGFYRLEF